MEIECIIQIVLACSLSKCPLIGGSTEGMNFQSEG